MNNFSLTKDFHIPDTPSSISILQNLSANSGLPTDFPKALKSSVSQFSVISPISFQLFLTVTLQVSCVANLPKLHS